MSATKSETALQITGVLERAIKLLGSGLSAEVVASTLGVSPSTVSMWLGNDEVSRQVTALRYEGLQKHNVRDNSYDALEDTLLEKMHDSVPLMMRPMEILKALSVINAAKRRGQSSQDSIHEKQTVVNLILPTQVVNQFQVDVKNTVIKTGDQELLTINPKQLLAMSQRQGVSNDRITEVREGEVREAARNL